MKDKILKNDFLVNLSSLGLATLINATLVFIVGILTRNMLGPDQYGYWVIISLIFTFTPLFQLGTLNAMNREIPFYLIKKEHSKVQEVKESVFSFLFTLPVLIVFLLLVASIFISFNDFKSEIEVGLFFSAFIVFASYLSSYIEVYFKSQQDFRSTSKLILLKSIANSVFTLTFVYIIGYEGMYIGMLLGFVIQIIIARKVIPLKRKRYNFSHYKDLIQIGFPILLVGLVWSLMTASDRLIISIYMSSKDLGNYSIGMLVFSTVILLPQVIGQVLYPKIVGYVSMNSFLEIKNLYWKVNKILAGFMMLVVLIGYYSIPLFIQVFMPIYIEGIRTAQILFIGIYPLTLVGVAANYFNSTKKQKIYVSIQIICIILNIFLSIILLNTNMSINSVALATSITFFVYFILMNAVFLREIRKYI